MRLRRLIASTGVATALAVVASLTMAIGPASARPIEFGAINESELACSGSLPDCTMIGERIPRTGLLTELTIGHGPATDSGASYITPMLFRRHSNGDDFVLIRDLAGPAEVEPGTSSITWTSETGVPVQEDWYLGAYIDSQSLSDKLTFAGTAGEGAWLYNGKVTTDTTAVSWNAAGEFGPNIRAIVSAPPEVSFTDGPGTATTNRDVSFAFEADEPATFDCSLDGAASEPCDDGTYSATGLAYGGHSLSVTATNALGQTSTETYSFTVQKNTPPPPPPAWGIPFKGTTWTMNDPVDGWGAPANDVTSVHIVHNAAGKVGVLIRYAGAGAHRSWVNFHRSSTCTDHLEQLWFSTQGTKADIWATSSMGASEFVPGGGRTSADGRETLVILEDPRVAHLSPGCIEVRSMAGSDVVDVVHGVVSGGKCCTAVDYLPVGVASVKKKLKSNVSSLRRAMRQVSARTLAARGAAVVTMVAPGPGAVGVEWSIPASWARKAGIRLPKGQRALVVGVGAKKVKAAGKRAKVKVKVTKRGRDYLKKAKRPPLRIRVGYLPKGYRGKDALFAATRKASLR
jgi:hypothetical protein